MSTKKTNVDVCPRIGIVMGDPAGIGAEIIIKTLAEASIAGQCDPIILGSSEILDIMNEKLQHPVVLKAVASKNLNGNQDSNVFKVVDCDVERNNSFRWGVADAINGKNSINAIRKAFQLVEEGLLEGIVIAPLNKESMHKAGLFHPDESAFMRELADVALVKPVVKWKNIFRCTVVGHIPFAKILQHLTVENVLVTIEYLGNTIRQFVPSKPRIGVAGLNPHAGEGGDFGDEESTILSPAIEEGRKRFPFTLSGPYPADTILNRALRNDIDGIVYLFHDQGNIAMKAVGFKEGVLIYSGLPFCVTSPGHGTAYGRAGEGRADHSNLKEALQVCMQLVHSRKTGNHIG